MLNSEEGMKMANVIWSLIGLLVLFWIIGLVAKVGGAIIHFLLVYLIFCLCICIFFRNHYFYHIKFYKFLNFYIFLIFFLPKLSFFFNQIILYKKHMRLKFHHFQVLPTTT